MKLLHLLFLISVIFLSCDKRDQLFHRLPSTQSGVDFINKIEENEFENFIDYSYVYNGGGVALGDINNDGLIDIYFTGNQSDDKLYLNTTIPGKGLTFKDITEEAGILKGGWSTGVTMADINGDGSLDIYVCKAGNYKSEQRANQLYINNGKGKFKESALSYHLADTSYSTQAAFFDYDHDNDLDVFLITSENSRRNPNELRKLTNDEIIKSSDKLYENIGNNIFKDVSNEAGIFHAGMSLGLSIADFNGDGWDDVFVGNDFLSHDLLYLNNKNGTFSQVSKQSMAHQSQFSMGADAADINDDGKIDLLSVDMMPSDYQSYKRMVNPSNNFYFEKSKELGYHPQFMRNAFYLNQGNYSSDSAALLIPRFSELAQFYQMHKTDWSWSPLIADFDNDGFKDVFITNGYLRDITDLDFITGNIAFAEQGNAENTNAYMKANAVNMPSILKKNVFFRNNQNIDFLDISDEWSDLSAGLSNGAAYADLDNDGDLDLVVNNINQEADILINQSKNNYITLQLDGYGKNTKAIGAKAELFTHGQKKILYQNSTKGYQSSSTNLLHFGIGLVSQIDSIVVYFEDKKTSIQVPLVNQILKVKLRDAQAHSKKINTEKAEFVFQEFHPYVNFKHQDIPYQDFSIEPLLPHRLSRQGPKMAKGDVNADGREDFFVGGAYHQSGSFFIQQADGSFTKSELESNLAEKSEEDIQVELFDIDNDNDLDLYIVSGSNEYYDGSKYFQDRVYLNDGIGNFHRAGVLPPILNSGAALAVADFDKDGDLDVFRGGRLIPTQYPKPGASRLLLNIGGKLKDVTHETCPELSTVGMVTDAIWIDLDQDSWEDLVVVGELMPVTIFRNNKGKLEKNKFGKGTEGFWNCVKAADLDKDGDIDLVLGNRGRNTQTRVSPNRPYTVYGGDFDGNSRWDAITTQFWDDEYPLHSFQDIQKQLPSFRTRFVTYQAFAEANISLVLSPDQMKKALIKKAVISESVIIKNEGGFKFSIELLPSEVQWSVVQDIWISDINKDGWPDIITVGNDLGEASISGQYDASYGNILINKGLGTFQRLSPDISGFWAMGDMRSILYLENDGKLILGRNNQTLQFYSVVK